MYELKLFILSEVVYICGISQSTIKRKVNNRDFKKKNLNLEGILGDGNTFIL